MRSARPCFWMAFWVCSNHMSVFVHAFHMPACEGTASLPRLFMTEASPTQSKAVVLKASKEFSLNRPTSARQCIPLKIREHTATAQP